MKTNKLLTLIQYLGFIGTGLVYGIPGPILTVVSKDLKMNLSESGLILSVQSFGMLFVVIGGGFLADKFGKKPFLITGSFLLIAGLTGSMFSINFIMLFIFGIIVGIGYGIYSIGINALCADLSSIDRGKSMNYLHFFFGIGAISAPFIVTFCIKILNNWRFSYAIAVVIPLIMLYFLSNLKFKHEVPENAAIKRLLPFKSLFMWFAGITIFLYVGIELSVYGWLPIYWKTYFPEDVIPASIIGFVFWASLTLGRYTLGKIVDKIGISKYLLISGAGVFVFSVLWIFLPFNISTIILAAIIGLSISCIYPTIMASVTSYFPKITGITAAFISLFSSIGGFLLPSGIGFVANSSSIKILPIVVAVLSICMILSMFFAWIITIPKEQE
jgi:MFS family permease